MHKVIISLMELNNNDKLQILTSKTWDLHVKINEKIRQKGFSFCRNCSNHGRHCVVEEREKMTAISDSVKQLHTILVHLQGVRSRHQINERDEAIGRLRESRRILMKMVNEFPRKVGVVEEVMELIRDDEYPWRFKRKTGDDKKNDVIHGISSFLVRITRFGLEFGVIYASMYTCARLCRSRQQNERVQGGVAIDARVMGEQHEFLLHHSHIHLNVLCGRG